jgi:predicted ester cyclase
LRFVRRFVCSHHRGKIDSAAQYVWEDVVEQVLVPGQGPGLEGLKDMLRAIRAGFPDIVFSMQGQIAESDKVALGLMTQLGALPSSPMP